jgi:peptidoglycan hydrolase-like protein with peptidoglycan-binding domain
MRKRQLSVLVAAVVAAGGGIVVWQRDDTPVRSRPPATTVATVAVERTDLSTARTLPGTLGYGAPKAIKAPGGTVTWLPAVGATVKRGRPLYRNDDHPVVVLYGSTPLFRKLDTAGLNGRDVRVVVDNLRALGYRTGDQPVHKPRPGDAVYTAGTIQAVRKWQQDAGLAVTGTIDPADVVVLPGPARVGQITAQLGDPAAGGVLTLTGSAKAVTVPVAAAELDTIRAGTAVQVELPGGRTTPGTVTRIDRDAREPEQGADEGAAAEVDVTVTIKDAKAVRKLDSAPVQVSFRGESRDDVLAVPVAALLALSEGGHAVQIAGGPLVAVETGMFAKGLVEVSGDGLDDGTLVVTAS